MKENLLLLDFISFQPGILFQNKNRMSNYIGVVYSILIAVATVVLGIFFLKESTDRKKKFLSSSDIFTGNNGFVLDGFKFAFSIRNGEGQVFDELERYITMYDYHNTTSKESYEYSNPEYDCDINDRGFNYSKTIIQKCGREDYHPILHRYGGGNYVGIHFHLCENVTQSGNITDPPCYPREFIEAKLNEKEFYIFAYFFDYNVDHDSTDNIFVRFQSSMFLKLSTEIYTRYQLKFQPINYYIDTGYIFEDETLHTGFKFNGMDFQVDQVIKSLPSPKIGHLDLVLDTEIKTFRRSYIKLQAVAANIGGIGKFLLISGQLLMHLISKSMFLQSFFNKVSFAEDKEVDLLRTSNNFKHLDTNVMKNSIQRSDKQFNFHKLLYHTSKNNLNAVCLNENNKHVNFNLINRNIIDLLTSNKFKFTLRDYFGCLSKKSKLVERKVNDLLSYEKLISTIIELVDFKNYYTEKDNLLYFGDGINIKEILVSVDESSSTLEDNKPNNFMMQNYVFNQKTSENRIKHEQLHYENESYNAGNSKIHINYK